MNKYGLKLNDISIKPIQSSRKVLYNIEAVKSPLITSFERWSGKRKKILLNNKNFIDNFNLDTWKLTDNIFANLLSSDMRSELSTRTRLPKDFLLQLKATKIEESEREDSGKKVDFQTSLIQSKIGRNSYILNSKKLTSKLQFTYMKYIPNALLRNYIRVFNVSDIKYCDEDNIEKYLDNINRLLKSTKRTLVKPVEFNEMYLKKDDIVINCCNDKVNLELKK
ncbi:hypothetical protein TPHA_0D04000 [Tetrapisispora phaffii CBS 4417]|uniref:Required for respiratory growth protein 8, mitochondrial n=1 Tax=Tetrapisispora phaffii (strain ATCC 24235 / CBS 4417 / NBRC 1672 / NRRL Y-8282 / UCD 70-5) TaxID=1071381 RepID=G8BT63_TETPH|nr:hypothetical protein TPHA_0D04000 [Tetrapisispora phaffii CBS 4417]CCE63034.1 hypothetical protein TPHA_0D04000 [Tetrapisispora phaffii CBS 4417]